MLAVALAACASRRRAEEVTRGPFLVVARGRGAARALAGLDTACASPPEERDRRAARLLLGALPTPEHARLTTLLDDLATRLQARANPLWVDLDDDAPDAPARAWYTRHRPTVDAALELARGCWQTVDGEVTVAALARCPPGSRLRCHRLWGAEAPGALDATTRLLAWPITDAVVMRARTAAAAREVRASLRALVAEEDSLAALVLPEEPDEGAPSEALRDAAGRALAALPVERESERALLTAIASRALSGAPMAWLTRDPLRVVVVPRPSALTRPGAAAREVSAWLRARGIAVSVSRAAGVWSRGADPGLSRSWSARRRRR